MLTKEQATERVAKGAAHLDTVRPGWAHRIDVGTLTLRDSCRCVIGQLCSADDAEDYEQYVDRLFPPVPQNDQGIKGKQRYYGTGVGRADCKAGDSSGARAFLLLQDAWVDAIADRRLAHTDPSLRRLTVEEVERLNSR